MRETKTRVIASPTVKNLIEKRFTQGIERQVLTLRNQMEKLNRKTLGYSRSAEMHNKIIGTFIEMEHYI